MIKGIIRKTVTKSHVQVNINKVLEYLRSYDKFNTQNLWCNNEIAKGDAKVIWSLLDDIWNYYTCKNKITPDARLRKAQSLTTVNRGELNKTKSFTNEKLPSQSKLPEKLKEEVIVKQKLSDESTKYIDNYYNLNKNKTFEKYTDIANFQKIVTENVSHILNNSTSKRRQLSNSSFQTYVGIKKKK
jgi:hypothetical protein